MKLSVFGKVKCGVVNKSKPQEYKKVKLERLEKKSYLKGFRYTVLYRVHGIKEVRLKKKADLITT